MSTVVDDPCTNVILDFISIYESAGNYNAVIGNVRSDVDLSGYTIKGIYSLMDDLLHRGRPSTAVGRYQIIRKTMKALQARLDLDDTTRFTPELQDRLAVELLIQRGYREWRAGTLSDQEMAHNLSLEWASFPDPQKGGKSHYDGVGPNHAGVSLGEVYTMLQRARAVKPAEPSDDTAVQYDRFRCAKAMQQALQKIGLYKGQIDGKWGPLSRAAYNTFVGAV